MWWQICIVANDELSGHVQALVLTVQSKRGGPQTSRKIQTIQRQGGRGFAGVMALLWVFHAKHAWSQHACLVMTTLQLSLSLDAKAVWVLTASAERIAQTSRCFLVHKYSRIHSKGQLWQTLVYVHQAKVCEQVLQKGTPLYSDFSYEQGDELQVVKVLAKVNYHLLSYFCLFWL